MPNRKVPRPVMWLDAERLGSIVDKPTCAQRRTMASIGQFASDQAHHLGNLLLGVTFCLKQLRGRQQNQELEHMVERGFQDAEQGIEAMRQYMQATHALLQISKTKPE